MQFFDPLRPRLGNGRPCHLIAGSALPEPLVGFEPNGYVIGVMCKVEKNSFSWHHVGPMDEEGVARWLRAYREDPEEALRAAGYEYKTEAKASLKLEDLGL